MGVIAFKLQMKEMHKKICFKTDTNLFIRRAIHI
jgi:hypothetical protein